MESVELPTLIIGICGIETQHKMSDWQFGEERTETEKGNLKRIRCIDGMGRGCPLQMLRNSEENNN